MTITVKELIKVLKRLPKGAMVNIHSKYPIKSDEEWTFTPLVWDDVRVKINDEVMYLASLYQRMQGKKYYKKEEDKGTAMSDYRYTILDVEDVIIG